MRDYGVFRFVDTCKAEVSGRGWLAFRVGMDKFNALNGSYCRYRKIGKHSDNHFYMITFKLDGKRYRYCLFVRDRERMDAEAMQWNCARWLLSEELKKAGAV